MGCEPGSGCDRSGPFSRERLLGLVEVSEELSFPKGSCLGGTAVCLATLGEAG